MPIIPYGYESVNKIEIIILFIILSALLYCLLYYIVCFIILSVLASVHESYQNFIKIIKHF
ncbi:MAG: hypothetical protein K0S18_2115 [Anaerocolumna sp.]|nr:hypothetical protein [Anaerocolumna sp.]